MSSQSSDPLNPNNLPTAPKNRSRLPIRLARYAFCLSISVISGATAPIPPAIAPPAAPTPLLSATRVNGGKEVSTFDEPLRLIAQARKSIVSIDDYSCTLIKKERLEGKMMLTESVINMSVLTKPFSVHLRWQEPHDLAGQEVCYIEGKNNGKMRCRASGVLGVVGFVTLDPNDARARQNSRHSINEAGLVNLIESTAKRWEEERRLGLTEVHIAQYEFNKRRCTRVETIHPREPVGLFTFQRNVLYFDQETYLPVRVECYEFPSGTALRGEAVEEYSYVNLRFNLGLKEAHFSK